MACRLILLPPEILTQITELISGLNLIRLWRSGDKRLTWKLSTGGGTTSVSLRDLSELSISRYPNILDFFVHLTELSICCNNRRLVGPEALWEHLSKLNKLKSLELYCAEAEEWLLNVEESSINMCSFLLDEPVDYEPVVPHNRLRPFAATFPKLERLKLCAPACVLIDSDFAEFPESITSLFIQSDENLTIDCYRHFRGSHLKEVEWSWSRNLKAEDLLKLPSTLTSFRSASWQSLELKGPMPFEHLTKLDVTILTSSLQYLPTTLTSLRWSLDASDRTRPLSLSHLHRLTYFRLYTYYTIFVGNLIAFPPSLTTLELDVKLNLLGTLPHPYILPDMPNLRTLQLQMSDKLTGNPLDNCLSDCLTTLNISHDRLNIDCGILKNLPKTLQHLSISRISYIMTPDYNPHLKLADAFDSFGLPPTLTYLLLTNCGSFNAMQLPRLPLTLTTLTVEVDGALHMDSFKNHSNLSTLQLMWEHGADQKLSIYILAQLPRYMTNLKLAGAHMIHDWDEASILALPPQLTHLALKGASFTESATRHLPRSLHFFSYQGSPDLSSACFKDLPRILHNLSLESATSIKDEHIIHLPRYLRYITLSSLPLPDLTPNCIRFLPPALSIMTAPPKMAQAFDSHKKRRRNEPLDVPDAQIFTNSPSLHNNWY